MVKLTKAFFRIVNFDHVLESLRFHYPEKTFEGNLEVFHSILEFEADNLTHQEEIGRKAMQTLQKVLYPLLHK